MILHESDWAKYPHAIADFETKNVSFLQYVKTLKAMNISNHAWPLALHNPALQGVDPHSPDLDTATMTAIGVECKVNYWYYLREVCKVPVPSISTGGPYLANRGNMALAWSFFNNIDYVAIMPRQVGKSVAADVLLGWCTDIGTTNTDIQLLTRNDVLRLKNIKRLKEIRRLRPKYLDFQQRSDANNTFMLSCKHLGNEYTTAVAQADAGKAENTGRGLTCCILQIDEVPYCKNIHISLPVALASASRARQEAEANGNMYGNIYTTTAGKKTTKEGSFFYSFLSKAMYWTEQILDTGSREEAWVMVRNYSDESSGGRLVINGTFSYKQCGFDDKWIQERRSETLADQDPDGFERDYLNVWSDGAETSPLSANVMKVISQSKRTPTYTQKFKHGIMLDWFIDVTRAEERLTSVPLMLSIDSSNGGGVDGNGILIKDLTNMEVIASCNIKLVNLMHLGNWLGDMMLDYSNMTLMIENKSSGQTLLDIVAYKLLSNGIDPFRRIFNRVVDNSRAGAASFLEVETTSHLCDSSLYEKYKKFFGFLTNAENRSTLYDEILQTAARNSGHLVNSEVLVDQIQGLVRKANGRVDHLAGCHDDMVISWLMAYWFATYAQNLPWYGIRPGTVKSMVSEDGAILSEEEQQQKQFTDGLMRRIELLKSNLDDSTDIIQTTIIESRIKVLTDELGDTGLETKVMSDMKDMAERKRNKKRTLREALGM